MTKHAIVFSKEDEHYKTISLALNNYKIFYSSNIQKALAYFAKIESSPLLFLDLDAPDLLGYQLLAHLKFDKKIKDIRVILLGKEETIKNNLESQELQTFEYLTTPINGDALNFAVRSIEKDQEYVIASKRSSDMREIFVALFNHAPFGISITRFFRRGGGRLQSFRANKAFRDILGVPIEEDLHTEIDWRKYTHPEDLEKDLKYFNDFIKGKIDRYDLDKRFIRPNGDVVYTHLFVIKVDIPDDEIFTYFAIIRDTSIRKSFELSFLESERSKDVLLSHLPGLAYRSRIDKDFTKVFVSKGSRELTGYEPEAFIDNRDLKFIDLIAPEYLSEIYHLQLKAVKNQTTYRFQYPIITKNKEKKWVLEIGEPIINSDKETIAIEGMIIDINEIKKYEAEIKHRSEFDEWTGLHNRRYLETLMTYDLTYDKKSKKTFFLLNLNSIQQLTSSHGYHYIRDLMKKISNKLKVLENDNCKLYLTHETRLSFYIKNYDSEEEIHQFYLKVVKVLEPLLWSERVTCWVGVLHIPPNTKPNQLETILKNVLLTTEQERASDDKLIEISYFDDRLALKIEREKQILKELVDASVQIDNEQLYLQYQPIFNVKRGEISGFEALARFKSEKLGLIPPLEFIPLLERNKLMIIYGDKINRLALTFLKSVHDLGYDHMSMSINVSFQQLLDRQFVNKFLALIESIGVNPRSIWLELTEVSFTTSYFGINQLLKKLTSKGIRVAIDDFGTGFSSLHRLISLEINALKIDKAFLQGIELIEINKAITEDIISLGQKLGFLVVGEGVENETHLEYLKTYNCDYAQGYYLSRPLNESDALEFLKNNYQKK